MNLSWFKDLEYLAKVGNFSQAAQIGNISQPAFSRRIKALEGWVGTELVVRSQHPVVLTLAGEQILEASKQAFERLEYERSQILEARFLPDKYIVTFGTQHSIGWRFYPTWLQKFETMFGPIISRLRADDLPNCMVALSEREVDFVIAYESAFSKQSAQISTVEKITIGKDTLIPVCKPDRDQKPLFDFNKLDAPVPWLRFGSSAPITRHIDPLLEKANIKNRLSLVYENSMAGALRIRAQEGAGVAWLPHTLVAPDIETKKLVITGQEEWKINLDICLYRHQENANRITEEIWNFLAIRQDIPLIEKA